MVNPVMQMLIQQAQKNPDIMNNPQKRHMLEVLMSGDAQQGQQMANNLLQSYGVTKEQALQMAAQTFGLK